MVPRNNVGELPMSKSSLIGIGAVHFSCFTMVAAESRTIENVS